MNNRFAEGFGKGLSIIAASLAKKSGIKTEEKVYERVGRLKQKYPSISKYYQIDYTVETETVKNRKTKENTEIRKVKAMSWKIKDNVEPGEQSGTYFLRTSLNMSEKLLWMIYIPSSATDCVKISIFAAEIHIEYGTDNISGCRYKNLPV